MRLNYRRPVDREPWTCITALPSESEVGRLDDVRVLESFIFSISSNVVSVLVDRKSGSVCTSVALKARASFGLETAQKGRKERTNETNEEKAGATHGSANLACAQAA